MLILGISTSSRYPSAALMRDGSIIASRADTSGRSHSATLMALIEGVLADAGVNRNDLNGIAVDIGPGSFTGVRIGVSCANAMAYALGIPVTPVCSLAALRHAVPKAGVVCALIDARNGNGYAAAYEDGEEIIAPCPCVIEELLGSIPREGTVFVGDVKDICIEQSPTAELVLKEARERNGGEEDGLARASDSSDDIAVRPSEAVPLYLRPSQAERMKKDN